MRVSVWTRVQKSSTGAVVVLALGLVRCQMAGSAESTAAGDYGAPSAGAGGSALINGRGAAGTSEPAEKKVEKTFEAPVATTRYVWSANPKTGRVALIDTTSFQIQTVEAGDGPTWLAAVPGRDDAVIVANVGSSDASLLVRTPSGLEQTRYRLHTGANSWSVSDDGRYAIAWTDAVRVAAGNIDASVDNVDLASGLQEVTVIDLGAAAAAPVRLAVGYRPAAIVFAHGQARAFAVTADGMDVLELAGTDGPRLARTIKYASEPATVLDAGSDAVEAGPGAPEAPHTAAPDVSITKDGATAIVRRDGSAQLDIVDLATAMHTRLVLSGPISDATLSPDGKSAIAVLRTVAEVDVVPLPSPTLETIVKVSLSGHTVGRAIPTDDGKLALLFTTALAVDELVVLTLATGDVRVIGLHAPVLAVFPTHDGSHAVVLHDTHGDPAYTSPGILSLVPLAVNRAARMEPLAAPPKQVAIAQDGMSAIVSARDDTAGKYLTYVAKMPSLTVDQVTLASPPTAVGIASTVAYVSQEHPEGRVTFIDLGTEALHTVTGFELGASIYQWPGSDGGLR